MTERGREQVQRDAHTLQIGPSALRWDGDSLHMAIDEITTPWPSRLRGHVTLRAPCRFDQTYELAPGHRWCPIAPAARVDVELADQRWSGMGYLDSNHGDEPLERGFRRWDWSRARLADGRSVVFYDAQRIDDSALRLGLRFSGEGHVERIDGPPEMTLSDTGWRIERNARTDPGTRAQVRQTLTDAPFYARSIVEAQWLGERVTAMHESLSLARFDSRWVQALLPFRMPRRTR